MNGKSIISVCGLSLGLIGGLLTLSGCDDRTDPGGAMEELRRDGDTTARAAEHETNDEHNEHDDDENHEDVVRLTHDQLTRAGVVLMTVGGAEICTAITLPAEVGLNEDTVVHVTPRAAGVVTEVRGVLGRVVSPGEVLAVLASPELGEAKIAYLQAAQARSVADAEFERQQIKSENTARLLELLRAEPEPDELVARAAPLRVGEEKGLLLSAYARLRAAEANYAREQALAEKGLATQSDLLAAQAAFGTGRAEYLATLEEVDFTFRARLEEAGRAARVAASAAENAERRLHLLGLSEEEVAGIRNESDTDVARYELRSPARGRIVAKHLSPGERVGAEEAVFTIADLSTVWLNIAVSTEYMGRIAEGQRVVVRADSRDAAGVVDYVSALVNEESRTIAARVVLDNSEGVWRPGEFVTIRVEVSRAPVERAAPIGAVQNFEGREVIFLVEAGEIRPVPVSLGRRDDSFAELVGDQPPLGATIVAENSFLIKAELGKGAAGHDH